MTNLKILLVLPFIALLSRTAEANCAFTETDNQSKDYHVVQSWPVEHVSDQHPSGCLAKISDGVTERTVYTPYGFVCKLPTTEKIMLTLQQSCCDTGRQGDYPCGIAPKKTLLGKLTLSDDVQTSLTAVPAKLDKRVIPELVDKLEIGNLSGIKSVSNKLIVYAKDPAFAADMSNIKARLQKIHDESTNNPAQKENVSLVLLAMSSDSAGTAPDLDLVLSSLQNSIGMLDLQQMQSVEVLGNHPEIADKSVPVLLDLARRASGDPTPMLKSLVRLGPAVGPHLALAYRKLDIDKLDEAMDPENAMREFEAAQPKNEKLSDIDQKRTEAMFAFKHKELIETKSRAEVVLPLWREIVCLSRDNMGDSKMMDKERNAIMALSCPAP